VVPSKLQKVNTASHRVQLPYFGNNWLVTNPAPINLSLESPCKLYRLLAFGSFFSGFLCLYLDLCFRQILEEVPVLPKHIDLLVLLHIHVSEAFFFFPLYTLSSPLYSLLPFSIPFIIPFTSSSSAQCLSTSLVA